MFKLLILLFVSVNSNLRAANFDQYFFFFDNSVLKVIDKQKGQEVLSSDLDNQFVVDSTRFCRNSNNEIEKWSYHKNEDNTYGLIGENVSIPLGTKVYIDQKSAVCGNTIISGNVKIYDSYIYGGRTQQSNDKLEILGDLGVNASDLQISKSEINAIGKIVGEVHINDTSEISGRINIDSCRYQNNVLLPSDREFICSPYPVEILDGAKRIQINKSPITQADLKIYNFGRLTESSIKGKIALKADDQETWTRIPRLYKAIINTSIDPTFDSFIYGLFYVTDSNISGGIQATNRGQNDIAELYQVTLSERNTFNGNINVHYAIVKGIGSYSGSGYMTGNEQSKIILDGNTFGGIFNLYNSSATKGRISNSGYPYFVELYDIANFNDSELNGRVTAYEGSIIEDKAKIFGEVLPTGDLCYDCNGVVLNEGSSVKGTDTIVSGWVYLGSSHINSGSKVFATQPTPTEKRMSRLHSSTLSNSTQLAGAIYAEGASLSGYSYSGNMRCGGSTCRDWDALFTRDQLYLDKILPENYFDQFLSETELTILRGKN